MRTSFLTEKIPSSYPELFERCVYDRVGDGWYPLLKSICDRIREANKTRHQEQQIMILQVKEKFAGLRVYIHPADKDVRAFITQVENQSFSICEECGAKGVEMSQKGQRYVTLCAECLKKP